MTIRAINAQHETIQEQKSHQIDDRFITTIQGKEFVLYAGLLDLAHRKGLKKLLVEILQFPSQENDHTAICRAVAETNIGEIFTDIGDANPTNTNKKIVHYIIRMASTRAKARCLRDLTNVGLCAVEELGDVGIDELGGVNPLPKNAAANGYRVQNGNGNGNGKGNAADQVAPKASIAQVKAIQNIAKRHKITDDDLVKIVQDTYKLPLTEISSPQAAELIRTLQKAS